MIKKTFLIILSLLLTIPVYARNIVGIWHNDLRTLFLKNNAVIYTINMRTFSANDKNGNEIIDEDEESGNFITAINRLDDLKKQGINALHVLPITTVGKIKAFGTAGSLYAITSFNTINPQIVSKKHTTSPNEQAKNFIQECHNRDIRVIIDLPSCGGYDLYLEHPEYFTKDENDSPVIPLDWTDVRLFNAGDEKNPNKELLKLHKDFIDLVMSIGADGIRADVARLKPKSFWTELIKYAREKDKEFLFLAEASEMWNQPVTKYALNTSVTDLFNSGFDGYLGSYMNFKNIDNAKDFMAMIQSDLKLFSKYKNKKSAVGSFSTHDEVSPILIKGADYSKMIIWLNSTLPINSYYIDGFPSGDTYNYQWANKYASKSQTDDDYYFTHNGQLDIFNFSRKPGGKDYSIYQEFVLANKFKNYYAQDLSVSKFTPLKSSNSKVFSYARVMKGQSIIVIGNLDFKVEQSSIIKVPKFKQNFKILNLRVDKKPKNLYSNGKIQTHLNPGEIQVLLIKKLVF